MVTDGLEEHHHTYRAFDDELQRLHGLVLGMAEFLGLQLQSSLDALANGDLDLASKVISGNAQIKRYEAEIDSEVLEVIARQCPVANDLRMVISSSKIVVELVKAGDELAEFARMVKVLFDPNTSDPNEKVLVDILKIGDLVKQLLADMVVALDKHDAGLAYSMLHYNKECEAELQEGIKHQLELVLKDARMTRRALDIMQMMKSVERCGEHFINVAEYIIFIKDGVDVRHALQPPENPHPN